MTVVVQQLAPVCRVEGRIRVAGRAGVNTVALRPRVAGHDLAPGTYRFSVKTRNHGRGKSVILVVVSGGTPSTADVAAARRSNACGGVLGASDSVAARSGGSPGGGSGSASGGTGAYRPPAHKGAQSSGSQPKGHLSAVAPTPKAEAAPLLNPTQGPHAWIRMLLLAGFAIAALLLAAAALPAGAARGSRTAEIVARRRSELGLAGGVTLLAFALAYVLTTLV